MDALKHHYVSTTKVEFLYPDETVAFDISGDCIQDGSSVSVQYQSGARRSATLVVDNWENIYDMNVNKVWFGQKIRISAGIYMPDGTQFTLPQGIFYVNNPEEVFDPSTRTTTFSLSDKWSYLDGSLFGNFAGVYQLIPGNNLFVAIQQLLLTDRGNGEPLDRTPPLLDSSYIGKTYTVADRTYNYLDCPYTAKISGNYASVVNEINTMLVSVCGYDCRGRFVLENANTDVKDDQNAVQWDYTTNPSLLVSVSRNPQLTEMYNHVIVTGGVLNGHIAKGEAINDDLSSPTNVSYVGKKTYVVEQSKYYADEQCLEMAKYELTRRKRLSSQITIETLPIYHLQEHQLIALDFDNTTQNRQLYLIDGYELPLGQTENMSITASLV